jgi:hypothetical protein
MRPKFFEFSLSPQLLDRGFWIYAWKIKGPNGQRLSYVGMTGDVTGVAQSPFARAGAHLGYNLRNNALRRRLSERGIDPNKCKELVLVAYGPIYSTDEGTFEENRQKVGKLERALWETLKDHGFDPVNSRPAFGQDFEQRTFMKIRSAFTKRFRSGHQSRQSK